jgi:hypothetical protein
MGPRTGLDVEKILDPTRTQTPTPLFVQPIASRSTDCTMLANDWQMKNSQFEEMTKLINITVYLFHQCRMLRVSQGTQTYSQTWTDGKCKTSPTCI